MLEWWRGGRLSEQRTVLKLLARFVPFVRSNCAAGAQMHFSIC